MALSDHLLLYCEWGVNEGLFAEPFNAASNRAFLLAALAAILLLLQPEGDAQSRPFPAHRARDRAR